MVRSQKTRHTRAWRRKEDGDAGFGQWGEASEDPMYLEKRVLYQLFLHEKMQMCKLLPNT